MTHVSFRTYLVAGIGLLSLVGLSSVVAQTGDKDCRCRAPGGGMRDLGTIQCVDIAGRPKLVMCTMSTNTPYWKDVENVDGCPTA